MNDRNTYDRGPFEHEMMAKAEAAAMAGIVPPPPVKPGRLMISCERLAEYQSRIDAITERVGLIADRTIGAEPTEASSAHLPQLHNDPSSLEILEHWLNRTDLALEILQGQVRRLEGL